MQLKFGSAIIDELSQPLGSKPSPHIIPGFICSLEKFIYFDVKAPKNVNYT